MAGGVGQAPAATWHEGTPGPVTVRRLVAASVRRAGGPLRRLRGPQPVSGDPARAHRRHRQRGHGGLRHGQRPQPPSADGRRGAGRRTGELRRGELRTADCAGQDRRVATCTPPPHPQARRAVDRRARRRRGGGGLLELPNKPGPEVPSPASTPREGSWRAPRHRGIARLPPARLRQRQSGRGLGRRGGLAHARRAGRRARAGRHPLSALGKDVSEDLAWRARRAARWWSARPSGRTAHSCRCSCSHRSTPARRRRARWR